MWLEFLMCVYWDQFFGTPTDIRGWNVESAPNPQCCGYPNPQTRGRKSEPGPQPTYPKSADIRSKPDPLPSVVVRGCRLRSPSCCFFSGATITQGRLRVPRLLFFSGATITRGKNGKTSSTRPGWLFFALGLAATTTGRALYRRKYAGWVEVDGNLFWN
jgi:hypothetical protein